METIESLKVEIERLELQLEASRARENGLRLALFEIYSLKPVIISKGAGAAQRVNATPDRMRQIATDAILAYPQPEETTNATES